MRSVMNSIRLFVAWLPWKPCSWYSTRTKLLELNPFATEWRCLVWEVIVGELILMNLCRPALGVQVFLRHSVYSGIKCLLTADLWTRSIVICYAHVSGSAEYESIKILSFFHALILFLLVVNLQCVHKVYLTTRMSACISTIVYISKISLWWNKDYQ